MKNDNNKMLKKNNLSQFKTFFSEMKSELNKVTWPTPQKVRRSTSFIIVICIFFALYVSGLDFVFSRALDLLKR